MMNSRFRAPDKPRVGPSRCDGCNFYYEELSSLIWGRCNGLIKRLLCISCDTDAEKKVPYTVTQKGAGRW